MSNCNSCPSSKTCGKTEDTCGIENNAENNIKKVIGVMSGKGGVGKSTVSVLMAKQLRAQGYSVGVLDADITGPSIPRLLGVEKAELTGTDKFLNPVETEDGIKVMSFNFLVEDENEPALWRGPIIGSTVKQFWTEVLWGDLDYLIIDMPPGTGDVALTVMQSIPINGLVMVSVPQDMVSMIVAKAVNMAKKMDIKVIGVVQNMSYVLCPDCDKKIKLFDAKNTDKFLEDMDIKLLGEMPMVSEISNISANGYDNSSNVIENIFSPILKNILKELE